MSEAEINLKALRKIDPYVKEIVAQCSNVALYNFNSSRAEWEKTEVEGTLFLFKREAEPKYGFTIMNRLNPQNHIEPVTGQLDFQIESPFLLYKNRNGEIRGIWFYSKTECESVGKRMQLLVKEVEQELEEKSRKSQSKSNGTGGNLEFLLKRAEKQKVLVEETPEPTDTGRNLLRLLSQPENVINDTQMTTIKQKEEKNEGTSESVKDFFAMASNSQNLRSTPQFGEMGPGVPVLNGVSVSSLEVQGTQPVNAQLPPGAIAGQAFGMPPAFFPILQTSQGMPVSGVPATGGFSPYASGSSTHFVMHEIMKSPGAITVEKAEQELRKSSSPLQARSTVSTPLLIDKTGEANLQRDLGSGHLGDMCDRLKAQLNIGTASSLIFEEQDGTEVGPVFNSATNGPLKALRQSGSPPTLLSPQVFSSSIEPHPTNSKLLGPDGERNAVGVGGHAPANFPDVGSRDRQSITPLTRLQMIEALEYLLVNDDSFTHTLHQAYIKSLSSKFNVLQ